ncbi:hypothetical protein M422DRAFT_250091 [Sphaerobolus stellatus SS14]|nr:hypothetical protein M422DRAFT_250091 [Sphaerobolus stellatus SS14]
MARSGVLVVLVRLRPMFGHPFLSEVLNLAVFNPSIRNPPPVQFKDKFDPLPLPVVAYTCTLIHCTLKSLLKEDSPDECQVLKSLSAEGRKSLGETQEAVCTNKRTPASGGLLQDTFDKELSMLCPILPSGPSVVTSGIAIGAALGPGASVSYAIVLYDSASSTLILQQIYPSPTVYR